MHVRTEEPRDWAAVRALHKAAFGTSAEAELVDSLRAKIQPAISLVAEDEGVVAAHILFSPVSLANRLELKIMGLGPLAVVPEQQRKGIGSALVRAGLERCKEMGCDAVVVVGHPSYYPRFGFVPGSGYSIKCEYDVPDDVFMIAELRPEALRGVSGVVSYDPLFSGV
jgi:putative acetyltransferase